MNARVIEPTYHNFLLWTEETKDLILRIYNSEKLRVNLERDVQNRFDPATTQLEWLTRPGTDFKTQNKPNADGSITLTDLWAETGAVSGQQPRRAAIYSNLSKQGGDIISKPNTLAVTPNTTGVLFYGMTCCAPEDVSALIVLKRNDGSFIKGLRHTNKHGLPAELKDIFTDAGSLSIVDNGFMEHLHMHAGGIAHSDCGARGGIFAQDARKRSGFTCETL